MSRKNRPPLVRLAVAGGATYLAWRLAGRVREESLAGRVVLITGGSRGLGLLLARAFVREGCRVAICARDPLELSAALQDLAPQAEAVLALQCDVADREQVEQAITTVERRFGRLDVLVNNASIIQMGPLGAMRVEDFERALAVNFWGGVYATFAALPGMKARGEGRIVNITSIGGKVAVPHLLPYACAKFAMVGFSQGLRAELAQDGVRVTTILPGLMRTGSPVNAFFRGDAEREWDWFALSSATPLTTMSAERAARRIVLATKRGEAEVTLGWQAKLLRVAHDLFPGTTTDLLGLVNRLLPDVERGDGESRGMALATDLAPSAATGMMNRAAHRTHQYAGRPTPSAEHAERVGLDPRLAADHGRAAAEHYEPGMESNE